MKMRSLVITLIALSVIIFFAYTPVQKDKVNLIGSWEIVSYIDHAGGGTEWLTYGSEVIKQKHITPTHFTWIHYNTEQKQLVGLGGGTYTITEDGKYLENIDFFYPPGSSELGQSIPFDVEFKDSQWYHTGFAKRMEINGLGLVIVTDSVKIEEIWSPILPEYKNKKDIIGTWRLEKMRDSKEVEYQYYPDYMGYLKLITPTNFLWVQYNKDGDEIYATGSGPYQYDKKKYTEYVKMVHPQDDEVSGATIEFDIELTGTKWKHFGYVPLEGKSITDGTLIDEFWMRYTSDIDDVTAFDN